MCIRDRAERYFKERRIPYQLVDVTKKGISPGEYRRIRVAVGGLQALLDEKSAAYEMCIRDRAEGIEKLENRLHIVAELLKNLQRPGLGKALPQGLSLIHILTADQAGDSLLASAGKLIAPLFIPCLLYTSRCV